MVDGQQDMEPRPDGEEGRKGGEIGDEERYFTPIRWDEVERFAAGLHVSRPKRGEFDYPAHVDIFLRKVAAPFRQAFGFLVRHSHIQATGARVTRFGFLLHPSEGYPLFGLNIRKSATDQEYAIFVTPFLPETVLGDEIESGEEFGAYDTPRRAARRIVRTMLHELAHLSVQEEGIAVAQRVTELVRAMPEETKEAEELIAKITSGGRDADVFSRQYLRSRDGYLQEVRRSGREVRPGDLLRSPAPRPQARARERRGVSGDVGSDP
jgi:hypothetical protein